LPSRETSIIYRLGFLIADSKSEKVKLAAPFPKPQDTVVRKRIVTGVMATAVIGLVGFMVWQPKKGTVEWHQREYRAAANRLAENRLYDRLKHALYRTTGNTPGKLQTVLAESRNAVKIEEHRKALVQLGYLVEKQFALKYRAVDQIKVAFGNALAKPPNVMNGHLWISTQGDTIVATTREHVIGQFSVSTRKNTIVVTAPRDVMAKCEEQIRKADVP
jgi:hypothetical protein